MTGTAWRLRQGELSFGGVTHVMGVINLSPESRNTPTVVYSADQALELARRYREWGASVIDLGGQSSRYDTPTITGAEEIRRLIPAVTALADDGFLVSVDTWKPEVVAAALEAGAAIVNDTGGMTDRTIRRLTAEAGAAAVLVYVEGRNPHAVGEIEIAADKAERSARWLEGRLSVLDAEGVDRVILDPGIALNYPGDYAAYTRMQLQVIKSLAHLKALGRPVLVPIPRKREDHRVVAYITLALEHEADLIRVHDVEVACDLVRLFDRSPQA